MYIDMKNYNIKDLKNKEAVAYINGHHDAITDFECAVSNYFDTISNEYDIPLFTEISKQIIEKFFDYAKEYLNDQNDMLLVEALDEQTE